MHFWPARIFVLIFILTTLSAWKPTASRAYVQSGQDGVSYARVVPEGKSWKGYTEIFKVDQAGDKLLHRIPFYAPGGVSLCWSPVAGKWSTLMWNIKYGRTLEPNPPELRFFSGDTLLRTYSSQDLKELGVKVSKKRPGHTSTIDQARCEQVPNTNNYDFMVESEDQLGKPLILKADILTGDLKTN